MQSFRIMARELAAAVSACASVADRGQVPILKTIRIIADGQKVEFVATDTSQTLICRAACEGSAEFCIDADALMQKTKSMKSGEVQIDCDGQNATISQGRTKWKIPVLPIVDFPSSVADPVDGETVELPASFMTDFNSVSPHTDQSRPFIMGVRFDGDMIIGTNGNKLAAVQVSVQLPSATIPNAACAKLAILGENVSVTISNSAAMFSTEFMSFKTQRVYEAYPDWRRVLPTLEHSATVDRAEFMQAVARAGALKNDGDKVKYVQMRVLFGDGEIEIMSRNSIGEEGVDYAKCERDGPEKWVGFVGFMLSEVLQSMTAETIRIRYTDEKNPITIEPVVSNRTDIRVVMPRQLPAGFGG
jgi:DNA polymerase III subunit beta